MDQPKRPIKTQKNIKQDLQELHGRSILESAAFPKQEWGGWEMGGFRRVDRFYFHFGAHRQPRVIRAWPRKMPNGLHPYGGSGYWCLSRACVKYVLSYVRSHPEVPRFFATTYIPDEMFFQTILANSPLQKEIVSALIHYLDWSGGGGSPSILNAEMLPAAFASGAWFARKFEDLAVLERIDQLRENAGRSAALPPWRRSMEMSAAAP